MSQTEDGRDAGEINRLLAGAAKTIAKMRYCWLVTEAESGGASTRPMGRVQPETDQDDWTIRFIADGRSRKAFDIRRTSKVALIFQRDADDAFAVLTGRATLLESPSEVRQLWKDVYNALARTAADRANAIFIEVHVERMELWIRGVTQEPFGSRTALERDTGGIWRLTPDDRNPA